MLRKAVLAFAVMGILSVFGLAQASDDGSVPWPGLSYEVQQVPIILKLCPPLIVALCCSLRGCQYYPGNFMNCWCTSYGEVVCMYHKCIDLPVPPCCICARVTERLGIPCTPGKPVPQQTEGEK